MANKFNQHFENITNEQDRGGEFKSRIENLPGKNWKAEISNLSKEFGLNASHVMQEVRDLLAKSLDGEGLKSELHNDMQEFTYLYEKTKIKAFKESEEILESIKQYVDKVKTNTEKRLISVLFKKPSVVSKISRFQDADQEAENEEQSSSEVTMEANPENRVLSILNDSNIGDEEKLEKISEDFRTQYQMQRMSWKKFADVFGLSQEYKKLFNKDISVKVLQNLFLLKHNPEDKTAKRVLDNALDPTYKPEGEKTLGTPGVKIIGTIDLSKIPTKKTKEEKKNESEYMQPTTTDPLTMVGEKMSLSAFIGASKLSYNELRMHEMKNEPVAGRYRGYNPNPTKSGKIAHFFTVGFEDKGIHKDIPVNAFVEVEPSMKFDDDMIYKIRIVGIKKSNKISDRKQSMSVQGELVVDVPEAVGSGASIGESVNPADLKKLQSRFNSN